MGVKLLRLYKFVNDELGRKNKVLLTAKTRISITQAAVLPDSAENLEIFRRVIREMTDRPLPEG